jgi:hypothetical protein
MEFMSFGQFIKAFGEKKFFPPQVFNNRPTGAASINN